MLKQIVTETYFYTLLHQSCLKAECQGLHFSLLSVKDACLRLLMHTREHWLYRCLWRQTLIFLLVYPRLCICPSSPPSKPYNHGLQVASSQSWGIIASGYVICSVWYTCISMHFHYVHLVLQISVQWWRCINFLWRKAWKLNLFRV